MSTSPAVAAILGDLAALSLLDETRAGLAITHDEAAVTITAPTIWNDPRRMPDWATWALDVRAGIVNYDQALRAYMATQAPPTPSVETTGNPAPAPETTTPPAPEPIAVPVDEPAAPDPTPIAEEPIPAIVEPTPEPTPEPDTEPAPVQAPGVSTWVQPPTP